MSKLLVFLSVQTAGLALALAQYCPESYGVQTYPHEKYCDKFYLVSLLACEAAKLNSDRCQLMYLHMETAYLHFARC
jgi:hypothetical protein